jgi:hypothetical protein
MEDLLDAGRGNGHGFNLIGGSGVG